MTSLKRMTAILTLAFLVALTTVNSVFAAELDAAIESGLGKIVKYGRWVAAGILAIAFCLAWADRAQNSDNPHEVNRGTRKMIWSGVAFVAVIGYKLILTGLVEWFNLPASTIPAFLWQ